MADINTLLKEAGNLRQMRKFKSAIQIYQPLWQENQHQFNAWDGWSYAYCLKELKLYTACLDICRQLYPRFRQSAFIGNLYAQSIYYTQIIIVPPLSLAMQEKAIRAMIELSPPHQAYSLTSIAIFKFCKHLMQGITPDWRKMEEILMSMDPDLLSRESFKSKLQSGKEIEYASQQEEWYSMMIRIKAGTNQPAELIRLLDEAQAKQIRWHYQNDIWMKRKRAFALKELGKISEAEKLLREILKIKKDWFLYGDLADILTDEEDKLQTFIQAALLPGTLHLKVKLFDKLCKLLKDKTNYKEIYQQLLLLIARIRLENGWDISMELEQEIVNEGLDLTTTPRSIEIFASIQTLLQKLFKEETPVLKGQIKLIHANGKSGILLGANGQQYFFPITRYYSKKKLHPGQSVSFVLVDGFDKKRNKPSKMAVDIRFLD